MKHLLTIIGALLSLSAGSAAYAASTGDEIKAALVGNTFQGGMGGADYASYFGADGLYKDKDGGGRFTIGSEGVCYPDTDFGCYQATINGDTLEWSKNGKTQGSGTIIKGNPLNY